MVASMALEFALKTVKVGSWSPCASRVVGKGGVVCVAGGFPFGRATVRLSGGGKHGGAGFRLAHVVCSDSARPTTKPKRKQRSPTDGPTKNELKLLKELQEFIAFHDLPLTEVPTTAELARNGRQDLANQVRRKGYKLVAQLLAQVAVGETAGAIQSKDITIPASDPVGSLVKADEPVGLDSTKPDETSPRDKGIPGKGGLVGFPQSDRPVSKPANVNGYPAHKGVVEEEVGNKLLHVEEGVRDQKVKGDASEHVVQESAQEFMQDGIPRWLEDFTDRNRAADFLQEVTGEGVVDGRSKEEYDTDSMEDEEDDENYELDDGDKRDSQSPDSLADQKADLLKSRLLKYFESRGENLVQPDSFHNPETGTGKVTVLGDEAETVLRDIEFRVTQKSEAEKEIQRLKGLLQSRNVELDEISRQLEEAKGMLSLAQSKATAELVHAKQLAFEQEVRLQAAEQALSQLKQVHLEWWGEAGQVELAGSFNGWQHNIILEPDFSSEIPRVNGSRGPMMWGTHLFLYPGVYEIKFIIDGVWQVDHRREIVMRHTIQNNLLRVE